VEPTWEHPGVWLRRRREAAGLTQEELSKRSGLSVRAIGNLERLAAKPHARSVRLIVAALGLPADAADDLVTRSRAARDGSPAEVPDRGRSTAAVPRQLPAAVAHFAGRAAELATLERAAAGGPGVPVVILAIGGMAGVGKTALALHWAHRAARRFPDGQLYVNLRGYDQSAEPADAAEVISRLLGSLGLAPDAIPAGLEGREALYRSVLADRRVLVMADNARDAAQVRPLLPGAPGSLLLVTTRSPLTGLAAADGGCVVNLDVPDPHEAAELLSARLGADRIDAEPEAAAELIRLCGQLPLALAIAAARAAASGWSLATLAAELADETRRLGSLRLGEAAADVKAVFSWSYRHLSPAAARMFRLLGIHPGPDISVAAAASLAGLPPPEAASALRVLVDVALATERVPRRHSLHDLVRSYAAEQARAEDTPAERREAAERVLEHYLRSANSAARVLGTGCDILALGPPPPGVTPDAIRDGGQAMAWFGAEHKTLLPAIRLATELGFADHVQQLPQVFAPYLEGAGHWHDLAAAHQLAVTCAEQLNDLAGQAQAYRNLGHSRIRLGQVSQARTHLTRSVALARQLGDGVAEAYAHLGLAIACECEGQIAESLSSSKRALDLAETSGDLVLQAKASNYAGYDYARLGDLSQALAYCEHALELHRQVSQPWLEANTWDSLGYIYHHLGNPQRSVGSYARAIGLFGEVGNRYSSARTLVRLGDVYLAAADADGARSSWQRALTIFDELASPDASETRRRLRDLDQNAGIESLSGTP